MGDRRQIPLKAAAEPTTSSEWLCFSFDAKANNAHLTPSGHVLLRGRIAVLLSLARWILLHD